MNKTFPERLARGVRLSIENPRYSACYRCHTPWNKCTSHDVNMRGSRSCFALCEDCWQELTPAERLPYYKALFYEWELIGSPGWDEWGVVEQNILNGVNSK